MRTRGVQEKRKRRSSESDDELSAMVTDAAGMVGDAVQIPSCAIWHVIAKSVANGARSVEAVIEALGGPVISAEVPEIVSAFTIECCLAVCVSRDDVPDKAAIRVFHDGVWRAAVLRNLGGARYAKISDATNVELTSRSWWYAYAQHREPRSPRRRIARVSLETAAPTEAVVQARKLKTMPEPEAITYLMKRLGGPIGDRMACLAVLALNAFQTESELVSGQTSDRNGRGWNQHAAPIAGRITAALGARRLLSRDEMDRAHEIVSVHASQLLKSQNLAKVLAFGCPNEQIVEDDPFDDEDEDFVEDDKATRDYPATNDEWVNDLGVTEQVLRMKGARFLNYTAYQLLGVLRDTHKDDIPSIFKEMKQMWPCITETDVHVALGHTGNFSTAAGQRIMVLWDGGFSMGVVRTFEPPFVVVKYEDGDNISLDGLQLFWHFVV